MGSYLLTTLLCESIEKRLKLPAENSDIVGFVVLMTHKTTKDKLIIFHIKS
jgi:hypothetical protein